LLAGILTKTGVGSNGGALEKLEYKRFPEELGKALFRGVIAGQSSAFSELMKLFSAPVYSYLVRVGVDKTDRDDLFQDIALKIYRSRNQFDDRKTLFPWLYTIAVNSTRNHFRNRLVGEKAVSNYQVEIQSSSNSENAISTGKLEAQETLSFLEQEIQQLSLTEREVIVLCCIEKVEQEAAAALLQIPINTLKTHLRRARLKLAESLAKRNATILKEVEGKI
jgi:RNA polymerase sigma factor (sigma-70 family)